QGMYVLPGLVDMHGHIGGKEQGTPAEYVFKLWMGHGITTIRDPGSGNGLDWVLDEKARAAKSRSSPPTRPGSGSTRWRPKGRTASSSSAASPRSSRRLSTRPRSA